jgi:hypothetical protein
LDHLNNTSHFLLHRLGSWSRTRRCQLISKHFFQLSILWNIGTNSWLLKQILNNLVYGFKNNILVFLNASHLGRIGFRMNLSALTVALPFVRI